MKMVKQHSSGFTLIEILLVLMMISLLTLILGMPVIVSKSRFVSDVASYQLKAMANYKTIDFTKGITFNHKGNINAAKTISIQGYRCVFQLGMGRYYCD